MTLPSRAYLPCLVRHLLRQIGGTVWEKFDKELGGTEIKPGDDQSLLDTNYITQLMSSVSEEFRGVGAGVDVVFGCGVVVDGDGFLASDSNIFKRSSDRGVSFVSGATAIISESFDVSVTGI